MLSTHAWWLAPAALAAFVLYTLYTLPHWATRLAAAAFPSVLFFQEEGVRQQPKLVALTIDDGPSCEVTPPLLRLLRRHGAHATMFVIGSEGEGGAGRQLLQAAVAEGHELGNHTWTDRPSIRVPLDELRHEIAAVEDLIEGAYEACGVQRPAKRWFRPGCGWFSSGMVQAARAMGMRTALGDVFPHDPWVSIASLNAAIVLWRVRPGSVIVLHDARPWLIPTLDTVLPELRRRGYKVVTLSELVAGSTQQQESDERQPLLH
ncbi:hypothetical protein FOA52_001741 [Chlamydomonas sp. UWO 241]|nr:hypothetical protein FOA52_001741 [Chlamydomonas sp. UWO 241]